MELKTVIVRTTQREPNCAICGSVNQITDALTDWIRLPPYHNQIIRMLIGGENDKVGRNLTVFCRPMCRQRSRGCLGAREDTGSLSASRPLFDQGSRAEEDDPVDGNPDHSGDPPHQLHPNAVYN